MSDARAPRRPTGRPAAVAPTRAMFFAAALAAALLAGCGGGSPATGPPASDSAPGSTASVNPGGPRQPAPSTTGGAAPTTTDPEARTAAAAWPTYHHDLTRAGAVRAGPPPHGLRIAWQAALDGAVYASPLVVGDTVFAATENDTLYALSLADGQVRHRTHLGSPVPGSALPCGNIDPLGVTGTPAYDAATGAVYFVAELADPIRQELVAVDARTGAIRWQRVLAAPGLVAAAQQQRAALAVAGGRVYAALGGLYGDCGDYHGYVFAAPTSGSGPFAVYRTPTARGGGIWAPSGPAVDGSGRVYVSVGNGAATAAPYDGSDAVVALDPAMQQVDLFAPTTWAADNADDLDLASTGPVLLPGDRLLVAGKRGTAYLLQADRLGGVGAGVAEAGGCPAYGGIAAAGRTAYLPCTDGLAALDTTGDRLRWLWRAAGVTGSPVVGRAAVWALDPAGGRLHALDPATGRDLATVEVGVATRFATPALAGTMILVPTGRGVVAVTGG